MQPPDRFSAPPPSETASPASESRSPSGRRCGACASARQPASGEQALPDADRTPVPVFKEAGVLPASASSSEGSASPLCAAVRSPLCSVSAPVSAKEAGTFAPSFPESAVCAAVCIPGPSVPMFQADFPDRSEPLSAGTHFSKACSSAWEAAASRKRSSRTPQKDAYVPVSIRNGLARTVYPSKSASAKGCGIALTTVIPFSGRKSGCRLR